MLYRYFKKKIPLEQMEPEEREQFEQTDPSKTNQLIRIILTSFKKPMWVTQQHLLQI